MSGRMLDCVGNSIYQEIWNDGSVKTARTKNDKFSPCDSLQCCWRCFRIRRLSCYTKNSPLRQRNFRLAFDYLPIFEFSDQREFCQTGRQHLPTAIQHFARDFYRLEHVTICNGIYG